MVRLLWGSQSLSKWDRFRQKLLSGQADNNIDFADLCHYVELLGFVAHPDNNGSHNVYGREGIPEIINLQPAGKSAKPYQVRQVRRLVIKYGL